MNSKRQVDYRYLTSLSAFYPLHGDEMTRLNSITDPNSEREVKATIRKYIVPHIMEIEKRIPGYAERMKDSLRYYLTTVSFPIEEVYYAEEPAFGLPENALDYYRWAWEVLFPNDDYRVQDLDEYEEVYSGPP